jgi:hypothetical protein
MSWGLDARRQRIEALKQWFLRTGKNPMDAGSCDLLVNEAMYAFGVTRQTAREYASTVLRLLQYERKRQEEKAERAE